VIRDVVVATRLPVAAGGFVYLAAADPARLNAGERDIH
jgi:hypothetical protein